jgi:hypothetical protein
LTTWQRLGELFLSSYPADYLNHCHNLEAAKPLARVMPHMTPVFTRLDIHYDHQDDRLMCLDTVQLLPQLHLQPDWVDQLLTKIITPVIKGLQPMNVSCRVQYRDFKHEPLKFLPLVYSHSQRRLHALDCVSAWLTEFAWVRRVSLLHAWAETRLGWGGR